MELSIFLAQIFAVVYIVIGLGMLINPKHYKKLMDEFLKSAGMQYLGGVMALVAGFLIVMNHNIWEKSWVVLITIIGWLGLIKGVLLFIAPDKMGKTAKSMMKVKSFTVYAIIIIALGAVLGYFGFAV